MTNTFDVGFILNENLSTCIYVPKDKSHDFSTIHPVTTYKVSASVLGAPSTLKRNQARTDGDTDTQQMRRNELELRLQRKGKEAMGLEVKGKCA